MPDPLTTAAEAMLNAGIARSETAAALCEALDGRALRIRAEGLALDYRLGVAAGRIALAPADGSEADVTISGEPAALLRVMRAAPGETRLPGLRIDGDAALAEQFALLLKMARPDPEEELARFVGDAAAHQAGRLARGFAGWLALAGGSLARSTAEFVTEEQHLAPAAAELDEFGAAVDTLVNDVARLEARIARLTARGDGE